MSIFHEAKIALAELESIKSKTCVFEKDQFTKPSVQKFKSGKGRIYSVSLNSHDEKQAESVKFDIVYNSILQQCDQKTTMSEILTKQMMREKTTVKTDKKPII